MQHVFVYGTLLFPEVVKGLTGYSFQTIEATLNGYHRCTVKNSDYPAIVKKPGSQVDGKILLNLDNRSYEILRFFEGDEYHRITSYNVCYTKLLRLINSLIFLKS